MRVLVCGSRDWISSEPISRRLQNLPSGSTLIHGSCRGADVIADRIGKELGFQVMSFPADWKSYGKGAGPIRNQLMLDEGKPDLVLAFHNDISSSRGTADMIRRAKKHGISYEIISDDSISQ